MEKYLTHPIFKTLADCANQLGVDAYVIGGYVRDIYLERESNDIDAVSYTHLTLPTNREV